MLLRAITTAATYLSPEVNEKEQGFEKLGRYGRDELLEIILSSCSCWKAEAVRPGQKERVLAMSLNSFSRWFAVRMANSIVIFNKQ